MVKHIILWKLKEEFSEEEKKQIKAGIKEGLEGLAGQIPGMTEIKVRIDCLPSSTVDVMLECGSIKNLQYTSETCGSRRQ